MRNRFASAAVSLVLLFVAPAQMFGQAQSSAPQASATQTSSSGSGTSAAGAQPQYPGIGPAGDKLEGEMGAFKLRLYGTLLLNAAITTAPIFGQDLPLWTLPAGNVTYTPGDGTVGPNSGSQDLTITMRQSVFGFTVNPAKADANGWTSSALLEMDFFGARAVDTVEPQDRALNPPRLRLAYFQLERNGLRFVFGQDKAILAPLDPISLSHVAMPLGATAGDLWAWLPQARVDWAHKMGNTGLLLQAGVLRPEFGDSLPASGMAVDTQTSGLGARSTQPFYEGRVAVSPQIRGNTSTLGVSGHFGKSRQGVDRQITSWAAAFDGSLPVDPHVVLRGEAFMGSNLIPFQGAIDQGIAQTGAGPALQIQSVDARGGWGEVTILPTTDGKNAFYVGVGADRPDITTLLQGTTRTNNSFLWASYFRRLTDQVTLAAEWSRWGFKTATFAGATFVSYSPRSVADVVNVSVAYQF
jgi:hypothetical protein